MNNRILTVENLRVNYPIYGGIFLKKVGKIKAVDDVSFHINKGEVFFFNR